MSEKGPAFPVLEALQDADYCVQYVGGKSEIAFQILVYARPDIQFLKDPKEGVRVHAVGGTTKRLTESIFLALEINLLLGKEEQSSRVHAFLISPTSRPPFARANQFGRFGHWHHEARP